MRRVFSILIILFVSMTGALAAEDSLKPGEKRLLREGWTLRPEAVGQGSAMAENGDAVLTGVQVPSTVAGALMEAGVLPENLLEGWNYKNAGEIDGAWIYENDFTLKGITKKHRYSLRFDGLNYYADIWLNGTQIASRDTMAGVFCVREFDVTPLLKRHNHLEIRLEKARKGDLNIGFVDWNPEPLDASMGIVRDVTLSCSEAVSINDLYVRTLSATEEVAELEVQATLTNLTQEPIEVSLVAELRFQNHESAEYKLAVPPGETVVRLGSKELPLLRVDHPSLWWCRGMAIPDPIAMEGAPMYSLDLEAKIGKAVSDAAKVDFGIRTVESRLDEKGHRAYYLNGQKLLVLGGGWTDDLFLRDTPESLEEQVRKVADMGLNCIRFENIWGKDATIYDLCDRYGILALVGWSCQWEWESYCGIPHDRHFGCINDPERNALAIRYFRDQLRWLRNHPSIIGFLTGSDRIPNQELENGYFRVLAQEAPDMPYVCSAAAMGSLAGESGNKMEGPYEYVAPEYWYDPDNRVGSAWGFNTETSIGLNMPQAASLRRMFGEDADSPTAMWDYHCTAASEDMHSLKALREVINGQFGGVENGDQLVRRAQAIDYDGTRAMFEAFRVRRSQCTGVVQWMLNSAWPSLYWQLYDYYCVPTAGYYGVKKALKPLQVCYDYANRTLVAVNGTRFDAAIQVRLRIYDAASSPLLDLTMPVRVPASREATVRSLADFAGTDCFVFIDISGPAGYVADNFYVLPAKGNVHDWKKSSWYQTAISRYADLRFLTQLPPAELDVSIVVDANYNKRIRVENIGKTVAYQVMLSEFLGRGSFGAVSELSDNFFSLAPGDVRYLEGPYAYYVADAGL